MSYDDLLNDFKPLSEVIKDIPLSYSSVRTFKRMLDREGIPTKKFGKTVYVAKSEIVNLFHTESKSTGITIPKNQENRVSSNFNRPKPKVSPSILNKFNKK